MELSTLVDLPPADQWTFLRGRIAETAVELDAALRGLHAQLRGLNSREALLTAAQNWTQVAEQCRAMLADAPVPDGEMHAAILQCIDGAAAAYDRRNRYMHDLLVADVDDELRPNKGRVSRHDERYLVRLTRKAGAADITLVTLDETRAVAISLVAATWRLRAARGYLAGQTTWRTMLLGHLEAEWDGTVNWTYSGPDADDLDEDDMPVAGLLPEA